MATTPCYHAFHYVCVMEWLYDEQTCPMCPKIVEIERRWNEVTLYKPFGFKAWVLPEMQPAIDQRMAI
jgi:hypothetical protein